MGGNEEEAARLFSAVPGDRTRDNRHKLKIGKFRLNTSKWFFNMRVVKHWNRLPREDVESHLWRQ